MTCNILFCEGRIVSKIPFICGAFFGFVAIMLGAYTEHGLKGSISAKHYSFMQTALSYQLAHAVIITSCGLVYLVTDLNQKLPWLKWSMVLLIGGVILFCGSIYGVVVFGFSGLVKVTPFGGMTLIVGWLSLLLVPIKVRK